MDTPTGPAGPPTWALRSFAPTARDALAVFVLGSIAVGAALLWPRTAFVPVEIRPGSPPDIPVQVNVNTAPASELTLLPGVGPSLADAIVASRESEGPFPDIDSMLRVRGIGPKVLEGLRPYVTVDPTR